MKDSRRIPEKEGTRAPGPAAQKPLRAVSGKELLDRILDTQASGRAVRNLAPQDFFWIVKKVGEEDALPLLQIASQDQWQYVLDLGIWKKDRIAFHEASTWLLRLAKADPERLAEWLLSEGAGLAHFYLQKVIEIDVDDEEVKAYEPPPDTFTLDGVCHIRVLDPDLRESVEELLRWMAKRDYQRFQALLLNLQGVLPAEAEEELYRLRNMRLAEHGFLPFEEALSVYASLDAAILGADGDLSPELIIPDEAVKTIIPTLPLALAKGKNLLTEVISLASDPPFMDKIRLEFGGLCNQILSAEAKTPEDWDVLVQTSRRAAAYLNLALESRFGSDVYKAERCLQAHPLVTLFRVGFGLALRVRWDAEQWVGGSWFRRQGFDPTFWGEEWGARLAGLLEKRPRYYARGEHGWEYRDFQYPSDLDACRELLSRLRVLDLLLSRLSAVHPLKTPPITRKEITFHPLVFNFWARRRLGYDLSFSGIPIDAMRQLLSSLRGDEKGPTYRMTGYEEVFKDDLIGYATGLPGESIDLLRDTLDRVWEDFRKEYEGVALEDLDPRYSRCVWIT